MLPIMQKILGVVIVVYLLKQLWQSTNTTPNRPKVYKSQPPRLVKKFKRKWKW